MSKESLEKHFPPGSPISLKDVEGDCRYKMEVVEFVENGVVGTNDKGEKLFVPWRYDLVMSEQGECDCINCKPDEYLDPSLDDSSFFTESGREISSYFADHNHSVVEAMISDLAGAPSVEYAPSLNNDSEDGIPPIVESRWGDARRYR